MMSDKIESMFIWINFSIVYIYFINGHIAQNSAKRNKKTDSLLSLQWVVSKSWTAIAKLKHFDDISGKFLFIEIFLLCLLHIHYTYWQAGTPSNINDTTIRLTCTPEIPTISIDKKESAHFFIRQRPPIFYVLETDSRFKL